MDISRTCRRSGALSRASFVIVVGAFACNPILGLDEPELAETSAAGTASTASNVPTGNTGASGSTGSGTGGEGGAPPACDATCNEGCFEGVCGGYKPIQAAPNENLSCVLTFSGAVYCSGSNRFGGLGIPPEQAPDTCLTWIGNGIEAKCSFEMRRVALPRPAKKIATGRHAVCAVLDDRRLFCWGNNEHGQLGHPPTPEEQTCADGTPCVSTPTEVTGLGEIVDVAMVSIHHTCATTVGGKLWCWGANTAGQLGNETTPAAMPPYETFAPFDVSAATPDAGAISGVALSNNTTCFRDAANIVRCMGINAGGIFSGDGKPVLVKPTLVTGTSTTARFAQSRYSRCIVPAGTTSLHCAGMNDLGMVQAPFDVDPHAELVQRSGLGSANIVAVGAGDFHFCALDGEGVVRCWGATFVGQLGNGVVGTVDGTKMNPDDDGDGCALANAYGNIPCMPTPQVVPLGAKKATKLFVGNNTTMAILEDDTVVGWGMNQGGQLGHAPGTLDDTDEGDTTFNDKLWCAPNPRPVLGLPTAEP